MLSRFALLLICSLAGGIPIVPSVMAEVVRLEITERIPFAEGFSFENTGPYELLTGRALMTLDPDAPANQRVHDLKLAPRNDKGLVAYWTDFCLLKPVNPQRGNGRLLYDVHNRGNKLAVWTFNSAKEISNDPETLEQAGNGFLMRHGYSVLWTGWNAEVPEGNGRMTLGAPIATDKGRPITGRLHVEICVAEKTFSRSFAWSQWGIPKIFPAIEDASAPATLTMRPLRSEPAVTIPASDWSFGRWEDGRVISDRTEVYLKEGFKPGWLYDLVYTSQDPRVAGVGLTGIRDIVSFLKHEKADQAGQPNPLAGSLEKAYIFGISQSGRLGVAFMHEGFNADLQGKPVFEAALLHVAGAGKGHFTTRFRNATDSGNHHEANWCGSEYFPFSPAHQEDPVSGQKGSVLDRATPAGVVPKMIYVQTSTEYWARAASLVHTNVEGTADLALPDHVRVYLVAGAQHLGKGEATPGEGQQNRNTLDDRGPVLRAMLTALDRWSTTGAAPPPSRYPRISDGTLVNASQFAALFPKLPGVNVPGSYYEPVRLDFGPRLESEGIADIIPPKVGAPWRTLVPAVDADGNETSGIILPEVAVPLGTHTGWNLRSAQFGPPQMLTRFYGMMLPFAKTKTEREKTGDPRPSLTERYPSRADYLSRITVAAMKLRQEGYLLDEDLANILNRASQQDFWNN